MESNLVHARYTTHSCSFCEYEAFPLQTVLTPIAIDGWLEIGRHKLQEESRLSDLGIVELKAAIDIYQQLLQRLPWIQAMVDLCSSGVLRKSLLFVRDPEHGEVLYVMSEDCELSVYKVAMSDAFTHHPLLLETAFPERRVRRPFRWGPSGLALTNPGNSINWAREFYKRLNGETPSPKSVQYCESIWTEVIFNSIRDSHLAITQKFLGSALPDLADILDEEGLHGSDDFKLARSCTRRDAVFRRVNTLRNQPGLAEWVRAQTGFHYPDSMRGDALGHRLLSAVDCGNDDIMVHPGEPEISKAVLRAIRKMPGEVIDAFRLDLQHIASSLCYLRPHLWPKTEEQFAKFTQDFRDVPTEFGYDLLPIIADHYQSTGAPATPPREQLLDLVGMLHSVLSLSPFEPKTVISRGYQGWELLGKPKLHRLIRGSEAWHRAEQNALALINRHQAHENQTGRMWPGLFENPVELGRAEFIPLCSPAELKAEGQAMAHCIGSCSHSCRRGTIHALRIRRDGRHIGTMTIAQARSSGAWYKSDARGFRNAQLSEPTLQLCSQLIEQMNNGQIPLNPELKTFNYLAKEASDHSGTHLPSLLCALIDGQHHAAIGEFRHALCLLGTDAKQLLDRFVRRRQTPGNAEATLQEDAANVQQL